MLKTIGIVECASCNYFGSCRNIIIGSYISHGICNKGFSVLCEKHPINGFIILISRFNVKIRKPAAAAENRRSEAGKRCGNCELEQAAVRKSCIADIRNSFRQSYALKVSVAEEHTVRNAGKSFSDNRSFESVAV